MAKRFIDTSIFRKDFIRGLDAPCKLLFLYIINECDHAGLWDVEIEVAEVRLGLKFKGNPLDQFGSKIIPIDSGKKWFIPSFINFQYGELNPENRAHGSVISILKKFDLLDDQYQIKPLTSPLQGAMDMDMVKDKEMDKVKKPKIEKFNPLDHIPDNWNGDLFLAEWDDFMIMRHRKKWACTDSILISRIKQLRTLSDDKWDNALTIMQKSTEKGYAEFFAPDRNGSANTSPIRKIKDERQPAVRDRA